MPVQAVIAAANYREESLPDEVWIKAAVAGGLWASFEIIIGSFLHNMRIPFAGSMLAVTGMVLMIAFHRLWPERGLIWRAGLICALMKSISPSSLILGPMIGILTEAMLLELSVRLLGTNKAGYITGGVLGVSSAIIHKIASILILYGFSLIEVYLNIYRFAARQFGVENPDPWKLLAALAGRHSGTVSSGSGKKTADKSVSGNHSIRRTTIWRHRTSFFAHAAIVAPVRDTGVYHTYRADGNSNRVGSGGNLVSADKPAIPTGFQKIRKTGTLAAISHHYSFCGIVLGG